MALETLALSAGASAGESIGSGIIGQIFANRNRSANTKEWQKQAVFANKLNRENAVDTASLTKEGYQKAGISTALLANGNFTPVATPSAPGSSINVEPKSSGKVLANALAMEQTEAGVQNLQAQNANIQANTEKVELENAKTRAKLKADAAATKTGIQQLIDEALQQQGDGRNSAQHIEMLTNLQEALKTDGALDPAELEKYFKTRSFISKGDAERFGAEFDVMCKWLQKTDPKLAKILAIDENKARYKNLLTTISAGEAGVKLTEKQVKLIGEQMKLIKEQTKNEKASADLSNSENIDKIFDRIEKGEGGGNALFKMFALMVKAVFGN